ncbi:MAG: ferrochelatase [Pirellulaceae bacterium]
MTKPTYDSILIVSFGGPEGPDDVMPFLENVLRGKNVPRERMLEVAEHYNHFGGVSPINAQNRDLIAALRTELDSVDIGLPIYWGNRNWHPLLADTLGEMREAGCQRAIAFFTSMFSCYSGCRQYRENIATAQAAVGDGAPQVEKLRKAFNHPRFIAAQTELARGALQAIDAERRSSAMLLFTAHSIPLAMATGSRYVEQLTEAAGLTAAALGHAAWELVYQSRSGPPSQPWLEPDVCQRIEELALDEQQPIQDFVVVPLGFVSDHMEVLFDLDTEARATCERLGVGFSRAASVGTHPEFVRMIRELIQERIEGWSERPALGKLGPSHDVCPVDCCLYTRPARQA